MKDKKEKVNFFQNTLINSVEQAEKEMKKQKILLIIKAVGMLLAVIGTIIIFGNGGNLSSQGAQAGMLIGWAGELIACFGYKVFKYWFKMISALGVYLLFIGWIIGFVLGLAFFIYVPAIFAIISLIESRRNYKAAKVYLDGANFANDTVNEAVANGDTELVEGIVEQIEENNLNS